VLGGLGVDMGDAVTVCGANVGVMIDTWVRLASWVIAIAVPDRFWMVVWVGEPVLLGRLQDERIITSKMDINGSLNVFICENPRSLMILELAVNYEQHTGNQRADSCNNTDY
jgi:hypothetical protein